MVSSKCSSTGVMTRRAASGVGHHGREGVPQNFELEMLIILGVYFVILRVLCSHLCLIFNICWTHVGNARNRTLKGPLPQPLSLLNSSRSGVDRYNVVVK